MCEERIKKRIPIFICGMPRSGTTLCEQILSSHSKVHGAGELRLLQYFGDAINVGDENINDKNITN